MEAIRNNCYQVAFTVNKAGTLIGTWPYLKPTVRLFRFTIYLVIVLNLLIPQIAFHIRCKTDLQCICEGLSASLLTLIAMIRSLIDSFFTCWKIPKNSEEYDIIKLHGVNIKQFSIFYTVYLATTGVIFLCLSLVPYALNVILPLNESRPLFMPHPAYYFVDFEDYFFEILCHSLIVWEILLIGFVAHESLFVLCIEHICSMFSIIAYRFEYLFSDCDKAMEEKNLNIDRHKIHCERIASFVHIHEETLKLAQLVENTFTIPFALDLLMSTIGLSITLVQVSRLSDDFLQSLKYFLYVMGQLVHIYLFSNAGQQLIDHSVQMRDKVYNSNWYNESTRSQKLIMFVMMKTLQPIYVSAGKVYIFSLESFTVVLQTSMSYFTVLANFQ